MPKPNPNQVSHGNVLADILVSELLGSWGDNELSPECLDGAQRYLKPSGISVPCDYTSYVAPLSSSRLWNEATPSQGTRDVCGRHVVRHVSARHVPQVKHFKDLAHFETQYVVKVHNAYQMAESQKLFTFDHPGEGWAGGWSAEVAPHLGQASHPAPTSAPHARGAPG